MARMEIVMPQMGESITTGTITKWTKKAGDMIAMDEILLEISTDKVESEIPAPIAGRVERILFPEGATIDVGKLIAEIEDDPKNVLFAGGTESAAPAATAPKAEAKKEIVAAPTAISDTKSNKFFTPLVKAMAKETGVPLSELENITGSGSAGRVNRHDFETYLSSRSQNTLASTPATTKPVPASTAVAPSGRVEIIPMDNMRKAIARNMITSKTTAPHVNSIGEVDMSHLVKFRETIKNEFEKQEGF
ncbi:MAG: 2-oxo acid dehydrogenase subunit E2 [Bacteriovoracaceae bacterium]|nr:2-oxo acid dehydrogenase subunit E2 [Bacteriovoracaceae bacterium]